MNQANEFCDQNTIDRLRDLINQRLTFSARFLSTSGNSGYFTAGFPNMGPQNISKVARLLI